MAAAPARNELSDAYPNPSNAVARTGMGKLWDYLTGLFGTDGTAATARAGISVYSQAESAAAFTHQNLATNPNFLFDQINEGALYTITGGGADVQTLDGWSGSAPVAPGVFKVRRVTDPDNAAMKAMEITCTTIDAAIAAADAYYLHTAIEGQDAAALQAGTATAQGINVQIAFKSSVTGVYGVSVSNSATNRSYVGIFTVTDALEHTYNVALTLDTGGTWLYDTGVGIRARICLAAGSNFQAVAGSWAAANNLTTSAQTNFMSNVANIAYLKRFQITPSLAVVPFSPPDWVRELAKVQRQYAKTFNPGVAVAQNSGSTLGAFCISHPIAAAVTSAATWRYAQPMRIIPAITSYNPSAGNALFRNVTGGADSGAASAVEIGTDSTNISNAGAAGDAANSRCIVHLTANARMA